MTAQKPKKPLFWSQMFAPSTDFYALLTKQAAKTLEGVEALVQWIENNNEETGQKVRSLEREADELKLDLERQLAESFVTPFDREDIYDLSVQMDEIINLAKATVREAEALQISLVYGQKDLATILVEGTSCLHKSFEALNHDTKEASNQAFLARKSERRFAKAYRALMRDLFESDDLKNILKVRETYRCLSHAADRIDMLGEKLQHVIVKIT